MFKKRKVKNIVEHTLYDTEKLINNLQAHDIYLAGGVDTALVASLFISFCDFYAYLLNNSHLGDDIVECFLEKVQFKNLYRGLIVDTHKDYHEIIKEKLALDDSPEGLCDGYNAIAQYICNKLLIDSTQADVVSNIQNMLLTRMNDIKKAKK